MISTVIVLNLQVNQFFVGPSTLSLMPIAHVRRQAAMQKLITETYLNCVRVCSTGESEELRTELENLKVLAQAGNDQATLSSALGDISEKVEKLQQNHDGTLSAAL
jgi:hypothetical protein